MKKLLLLLAVAMTLAMAVPTGATAHGGDGLVYGPNAEPRGASYTTWTKRFGRFLFEPPVAKSPLVNPSCDLARERHGVLFLPVAVDVNLVTHCRVEEGTPLLVSPGGAFFILDHGETRREAKLSVEEQLDLTHDVKTVIDGHRVHHINRFERAVWVHLELGADNIFGDPAGRYLSRLGGWFVIVRPLKPGRHVIKLADVFPTGPGTEQPSDITFKINVG